MKILLLSSVPPIPTLTGDRQRTHHLQRALQKIGQVDLLIVKQVAEMDLSVECELKRNWGLLDMLEPKSSKSFFLRALRKLYRLLDPLSEYASDELVSCRVADHVNRGNYDLVVVRYFKVAMISSVTRFGVPVALDLDDYDPERFLSLSETPDCSTIRKEYYQWKASALSSLIEKKASSFWVIWGANQNDRKQAGLSNLRALPNIPMVGAFGDYVETNGSPAPSKKNPPVLLVVSSRNRGNVEGIRQFACICLPHLRRKYPGLVLKVVGSNFQESVEEELRNFEWVEMLGRVEDLKPLYRECSLAIAPVAFGAGTSIKVLESFAYGRPCVMNRYASRGLEDLPSELKDTLISDSISDMMTLIDGILNRCDKIGGLCSDWLQAHRSNGAFETAVTESIASSRQRVVSKGSGLRV